MRINKTVTIIITLFLLAFFLRVYQLGIIPPSPDWDETAIGYNAYSLLKTGRDEYGQFLPLVFRSFDDYKPPLYIYLTVPSVAVFGLNVFAVRFPSALLGSLTVIATFLLVKQLFEKSKYSSPLAFLSALLLAISPWHLQFSRVGFETNAALFFNVAGAWLFLEGRKRHWTWILSALFFGLAPYTYHSARVFTPLLILGFALIFKDDLLKAKKWAISIIIFLFLLELPLMIIMLSPTGRMRISGVSVLSDKVGILSREIKKIEEDKKNNFFLSSLIHNRRLTYANRIIDGYFRHYDLRWLFLDGDNPRHHAPGMGLLYLWELPFLLFGAYKLFWHEEKEVKYLIFWWFLVAPIPASPTTELPHAVRTLCFLPVFQVMTAFGLFHFWVNLKSAKNIYKIAALLYLPFVVFNVVYYFHQYYYHLNLETSKSWQYGYRAVVEEVIKESPKYNKIVVSTKLEEPHMFFLFYLQYDPQKYLAEGGTVPGGFKEENKHFDKFVFRQITEKNEDLRSDTMYIGTPMELAVRVKRFYYLDGTEAMRIVEK